RINDTLVNSLRPKKKSYKIGLFLPLKTSEEGFYSLEYMIQNKKNFPNTSTMLADFYLGYKTALDSFSSSDFQVKTIVFDANENDSAKVTEIINSENFTSLDLIYGPWFSTTFNIVAKAAKENNIPCISTTLQSNKILADNNTTFKMLPSKNYMSEAIIEYIIDNNQRSGANVVNSEKAKDQGAVHSFKEYFTEYLKAKKGIEDTISEISGAKGGGSVTVLLSEDPAFVTSYFTQLGRSVHSGKSGFMLFGNYNLMNLENLDHGYYGRFNFHCVNPFFIDKQDEQIKKMWLKYRKIVYSDPSDIFFQLFDISAYFLGMMKRHGPDFFTLIPDFPYKGLVSDYNYFSPNFNTGFENRAVKLIEVKENRLSLVKKDKKIIKKTGNK
ncbi:MAG: ABC transporter substrate-binding protein, partial [Bacteroidota bacterium]